MTDNPGFEMKPMGKDASPEAPPTDVPPTEAPPTSAVAPPSSIFTYGSRVTMDEVTTDFNKPEPGKDMYTGSHDDEDLYADLGLKPAQPVYSGQGGANGYPACPLPGAVTNHDPSGPVSVWHTGQSTTVVVNQPVRPGPVVLLDSDVPIPTKCFNCNERITTYLYYDSGSCTWISCIALAVMGCDLGCCLIPFCFDYFKDAYHKCPKCHVVLGKHRRLGC